MKEPFTSQANAAGAYESSAAPPAPRERHTQTLFSWVIHSLSTWFYPFGLAIAGLLIWVVRWSHTLRRRILSHISLTDIRIKSS